MSPPAFGVPVEKYQFLKISPQDHKAVVKTPDGQLQVVGVGDVIADDVTVIEVAEGRIVLEAPGEKGPETVIVRFDGRHQRIERLSRQGDRAPELLRPPSFGDGSAAVPSFDATQPGPR